MTLAWLPALLILGYPNVFWRELKNENWSAGR